MAVIRRAGFGSVFEVENETVGIGTTGTATNTVQVLGETKASLALVTGISTLTTYQGFVDNNAEFGNSNVDINSSSGTMGNIEICHGDFNVSSGTTLTSSVNQLSVTNSFSVPTGDVNDRIHCQTAGSMRFNEHLGTLEFYTGEEWRTVNSLKDTGNRGRAVVGGGSGNGFRADTQTFNISTLGNSVRFGDLTNGERFALAAASDGVRGIFYAGQEGPSSPRNFIDEITMASEGDSVDFGDSSSSGRCFGGCGSSTRGIFGGINTGSSCDTIQFATRGSTVGSFITLTSGGNKNAMFSSPVRMISRQGENNGQVYSGEMMANFSIDTATIASGGTTSNFGQMTRNTRQVRGTSNSVRGMFFGGYSTYSPNAAEKHIDYITIASTGNAFDFGDLMTVRAQSSCAANSTRAVAASGGGDPVGTVNSIEFVNINTTGNAQDFGDLYNAVSAAYACSDSGGGLGGF